MCALLSLQKGLRTPVLLRFLDIVGDRITKLNVRLQRPPAMLDASMLDA